MRGRKPIPTAMKILTGNPGHRPLPANEPQHDPLSCSDCPPELTAAARTEWDRIAPLLIDRGQVTVVDRAVLAGYCTKYAQWQELEAAAVGEPFVLTRKSGSLFVNPIHGMANRALALMLKAAAEIGITPSSRTRVSVRDPARATPLDRFTRPA